ncbi:DUF1000-domain-containing protein [Scheffersomyces xylosifermentans]|uniref:DUF1000-domain-containing protein n=1 Tax=Scheffersomyces xylosifermentans TaxID=1304137 RepID=UPI00315DB3F3
MSCEDQHFHSHSHGGGHGDGDGDGHSHSHQHDHSHVAPIPTNISQSLLSKIDTVHLTALNLANQSDDLQKLFKSPEDKYKLKPVIKSDCDAQLIINIPFLNASVKLFSLILRTNGDKYCPKTIKLFKNDTEVDFDTVEGKKPAFVISHPQIGVMYNDDDDDIPEVLEEEGDFVEHYLPRHIFTGVQQLTIFIENIHNEEEEDESHLHYLEIRGEYTELNKDPVIALYESAANPADHKNLTAEEYTNNFTL